MMTLVGIAFGAFCIARSGSGAEPAGPGPEIPDRFTYVGQVVNERGEPVAGAEVVATHRMPEGYGYIATVTTDVDGRFSIDQAEARSGATRAKLGDDRIRIAVTHDDYLYGRVEDLQTLSAAQCRALRVTLKDGRSLRGRVADAEGQGVAGAVVQTAFKDEYDDRKAVVTDAQGNFELRGLPTGPDVTLEVLANEPKSPAQGGRLVVEAAHADHQPLTVRVEPITLPPGKAMHEVLGMKLVDADAKLMAAFHHGDRPGLLVFDAGADPARLQIGDVRRGDYFWMVGDDRRVKAVAEFKAALVSESKPAHENDGTFTCRVVYSFSRRDFSGSNTQYMRLTERDREELRKPAKRD